MRLNFWSKSEPETNDVQVSYKVSVKDAVQENLNVKSAGNSYGGRDLITTLKQVTGVAVSPEKALKLDTVYACIRDKSESIGQLPMKLYRTKDDTKELVKSGREHRIFTKKPNDFQTMQGFIETIVASLECFGGYFAYIERNKFNNIKQIIPFRNQRGVGVNMDQNGDIYFTYVTNDNKPGMAFMQQEILYISLFSTDGFTPMSPITHNALSIGLGIAQDEFMVNTMKNGGSLRGVLETDAIFKDRQKGRELIQDWNELYSGVENAGKTALLENGTKYKAISLSPSDVKIIESKQYTRESICSILRVPPERVGVRPEKSGSQTTEEKNTAYMRDSLVPLIVKIESALNLVLPDHLNIKLDTNGFTRGDRKSTVEAVTSEFKMGGISINEMREDLDRDPIEGGDVHAIDTNNLTFGALTDIPKLQEESRAMAMRSTEPEPEAEVEENET